MATAADFAAQVASEFAGTNGKYLSQEEIIQLVEDAPRTLSIWFSKGNAAEFKLEIRLWRKNESLESFDVGFDLNLTKPSGARMALPKVERFYNDLTDARAAFAGMRAWLKSNTVTVPLVTARDHVTDLKTLKADVDTARAAYDADPTPENQQAVEDAEAALLAKAEEAGSD